MKILVVSNMYPNENKPYWGTFVKACVDGYIREGVLTDTSVIVDSGVKGYLKFYVTTFFKLIFSRYDVVHVHYVTHSVAPVLFARIFRNFKVVLNFHGSDAFPEVYEGSTRRKIKKNISDIAIKYSDLVIVPSEFFKNKMSLAYDLKSVFVSPSGGVNEQVFKYSASGGRRVLFAGRMLIEKGPLVAANTVKKCWSHIESATFIGDGADKQQVLDILAPFPVSYFGLMPHSELASHMSGNDIFLFPSTRDGESLGLVVIEAIFSGMIPLVIDNGAVRDIIPSKYHDLLIAKNADLFDENLLYLLSLDSNDRIEIAKELYQISKVKFSEIFVSKDLYEKFCLMVRESKCE